jgi:MtN3 and saliva related transmembrane protein
MNTTQLIGIVAGILTATSMLPQLIKIIKHKKADDVSMFMLIVLLCGLATWIVYGILREDWPIIVTNCFSFFINVLMVIFRIKYSHKD